LHKEVVHNLCEAEKLRGKQRDETGFEKTPILPGSIAGRNKTEKFRFFLDYSAY